MSIEYKNNILSCGGLDVTEICNKFETPLYLYDAEIVKNRAATFNNAFKNSGDKIHFAVKANSNLSILNIIHKEGLGADIVSIGEYEAAIRAGFTSDDITFAGVGKREDELSEALKRGIKLIIAESVKEVELINRLSAKNNSKAAIGLRVNPNIDSHTHKNLSAGLHNDKFGMDENDILSLFDRRKDFTNIDMLALHIHIGSQVKDAQPFLLEAKYVSNLLSKINKTEQIIKILNLGGGLGVNYENMLPGRSDYNYLMPNELADTIVPALKSTECSIHLEPGRWIVAPSAILLTQVQYVKTIGNNKFVITDAGMTDFLRPGLYDAFHPIVPVIQSDAPKEKVNIVGPICESTDSFVENYPLQEVSKGDLLAIMGVGAYGYSLSSNYNMHPRPAEVMVENSKTKLIRRREVLDNLFEGMIDLE